MSNVRGLLVAHGKGIFWGEKTAKSDKKYL
jgi:hypothetical protein